MNEVERPLLAVVSPHPDDAALSASVTLRAALAAGWDVTVVTVYSVSDFAPFGPDGDVTAVTAARRAEDRRFVARLGPRARTLDLGRDDAPIRLGLPGSDCPTAKESPQTNQAAERDALRIALPDPLARAHCVLAPLGLGDHVDHVTTRDAVREVIKPEQALLYYEDLPYAAELTAEEVDAAVRTIAASLGTALTPIRVPVTDPALRYSDCRTYATQIDSEGAWALTAYLGRHGRAERLWSAHTSAPFPFATPIV